MKDFAIWGSGKKVLTMTKEYIGREEKCGDCIHVEICERNPILTEFSRENPAYCKKIMKAADVAPVRHGRWVFGKDLADSFGSINKNKYHLYCSECRNQAFNKSADNDCDFDMDTPFCPWCGAKMDKEGGRQSLNRGGPYRGPLNGK